MTALTLAEFTKSLELFELELPIALAVSGGPDSMALMVLSAQWAEAQGRLSDVIALTVDHGLRPAAKLEAAQVANWAQSLGIAHEVLTWHGEKPDANVQASAREARYGLLTDWCLAHGVSTLATAHHLDDQAETFLLRLTRGSGVDGLAAMRRQRDLASGTPPLRLIRPLLDIPRARLVEVLHASGQEWVEDPSNLDERYTRVRLRNVQSTFDDFGLTVDRMTQTAARMGQAREALETYAKAAFDESVEIFPEGYVLLDQGHLTQVPREIGLRILAACLKRVSGAIYGPRYERLDRLFGAILEDEIGGGETLHGCRLVPTEGRILVAREYRAAKEAVLDLGGEGSAQSLWDERFYFEAPGDDHRADLTIRALGEEGLAKAKATINTSALNWPPQIVCWSLPAIWAGEELIAVPHLDVDLGPDVFGKSIEISFKFKELS